MFSTQYKSGDIINERFEVVNVLGKGAMGIVYHVKEKLTEIEYALKFLSSLDPTIHSEIIKEIGISEFKIVQKLVHENVVQAYGFEQDNGEKERPKYYIQLEYVKGITLKDKIEKDKQSGGTEFKEALNILMQIANALVAIHFHRELKIVHGDLKPENILITDKNLVKLSDFGISKIIKKDDGITDQVIRWQLQGSLYYLAPEIIEPKLIEGQDMGLIDPRIDVFALGVIAYELLEGVNPFYHEEVREVKNNILNKKIPKLTSKQTNIPKTFDTVIAKCTEKDPDERFQSIKEVMTELMRFNSNQSFFEQAIAVKKEIFQAGFQTRNILIAVIATMVFFFVKCLMLIHPWMSKLDDSIETLPTSIYFFSRGIIQPPEDIVILYADEMSRKNLWPHTEIIPKPVMTRVLRKLYDYKPKNIIADYFYSIKEPNPSIESELASEMRKQNVYIVQLENTQRRNNFDPLWIEPREVISRAAKGYFCPKLDGKFIVSNFNVCLDSEINTFASLFASGGSKAPNKRDKISYYGPHRTIKSYSVLEFLSEPNGIKKEELNEKNIIIGNNNLIDPAGQSPDRFLTPYFSSMPGVEIQATILGNILEGSWIRRLKFFDEFALLSGVLFLITVIALNLRNKLSKIFVHTITILIPVTCFVLFLFKLFIPWLVLLLIFRIVYGRYYVDREAESAKNTIQAITS